MKKILILLITPVLFACKNDSAKQEKEKVKEDIIKAGKNMQSAASNAGDYVNTKKQQAEDTIRQRIENIDRAIDTLKKVGSKKSEIYYKKLEILKADMQKKVRDIKNSTAEKWDSTSKAADSLIKKSDREWTDIKQYFKELFKKD